MCGILALFGVDEPLISRESRHQLEKQLHAGLDWITHRGPDGQGIWIDDNLNCGQCSVLTCPATASSSHLFTTPLYPLIASLSDALADKYPALGHVRLAINDLSPTGDQPLHSPDGLVHAIVNGEIYDYDRLRALSPDYPYVGHSDSELVVALYLQYGQSFLSHLRGEFSLVIFDQRDGSFFAARDRYGIKPLFWTRQKATGQIWVAAEIKAFLGLGWEAEWDVGSIVGGGWGQDTRTVFRGVQKVSGEKCLSDRVRIADESCAPVIICTVGLGEKSRPDSIGMQLTQTR